MSKTAENTISSTQAELLADISKLEAERQTLFELKRPIDEKLGQLYKDLDALRNLLGEVQVEEMKAENFVPSYGNWFSEKELELVLIGDHKSMTLYKYAEHLLVSRFDYAFARDGYTEETGQTKFHIALVKGDKKRTQFVKDAILYFLPHLKWKTKDRYDGVLDVAEKRFVIFEHNLSANGTYDLIYTQDDKWSISRSYHRKDEYASLDAALQYIEENLWYERLGRNGKVVDYSYDEEYECDCDH